MSPMSSDFKIDFSDNLLITDGELSGLLTEVYVNEGYTSPEVARTLFEPSAVRQRGIIIGSRVLADGTFSGMVIVVANDSPANVLHEPESAELHLLAVRKNYRRHGLGRMLIESALKQVNRLGYKKVQLWTQHSMHEAQCLYESIGFSFVGDLMKNGRAFKLYRYQFGS